MDQLLPGDQNLLRDRSEEVWLDSGCVLLSAQSTEFFAYFLLTANVALVVRNHNGYGLAVGLIGSEGAVGLQLGLGMGPGVISYQVQDAGWARRIAAPALQQFLQKRASALLVCARYFWVASQEVVAMATSAQTQDIQARLAAWIVLSALRSKAPTLILTQTHLADMLGVRRASVTLAALELKAKGLVAYRRGKVSILDSAGLQAIALTTRGRAEPPN
ncbi:MAG: hypothetical protein CFE44_09920 [Burkholderiales bacterium PBB4]|nr:MAG: hypothetical protein CFE44_09920 [Burkholderiales bacterium PBB4]